MVSFLCVIGAWLFVVVILALVLWRRFTNCVGLVIFLCMLRKQIANNVATTKQKNVHKNDRQTGPRKPKKNTSNSHNKLVKRVGDDQCNSK